MNRKYGLIGIILFSSSLMAANEKPTTIAMSPLNNSPFYTVDVTVGKYGATKMLVDTGASDTVLADWFVEKNKISQEDIKGQGIDSGANKFKLKKAKVETITINDKEYLMKSILVVPSPTSLKEARIGGILSPQTIFEGKEFILDFPNQTISVGNLTINKKIIEKIKIVPCSDKKPKKYLIDVNVKGIFGKFYIDTGGKRAAMTTQFAEKLGTVSGQNQKRSGVAADREVIHLESIDLVIGKISQSLPIDVEAKGVSCPTADGKLGNDFLKNYGLYFDKERSVLILYQ